VAAADTLVALVTTTGLGKGVPGSRIIAATVGVVLPAVVFAPWHPRSARAGRDRGSGPRYLGRLQPFQDRTAASEASAVASLAACRSAPIFFNRESKTAPRRVHCCPQPCLEPCLEPA
jgi:hypothetical protein